MASHAYCRFILKTPDGYLTPTGTVKDIGDNQVLILNIFGIGGWSASKEESIQKFLENSAATVDPEKCELLQYSCKRDNCYDCTGCFMKEICEFWTDRKSCTFT